MRKILFCLNLIGLFLTVNQTAANAKSFLDVPVKVIEIKDLGLSDRDESKSVIEIRWQINPLLQTRISSFRLILSAVYADGSEITDKRNVEKHNVSARVEIPSVNTVKGRPPAFIKSLKASVTAQISAK